MVQRALSEVINIVHRIQCIGETFQTWFILTTSVLSWASSGVVKTATFSFGVCFCVLIMFSFAFT